jgi:hypothetical protein
MRDKGGWKGWTTSGMRTMTGGIIYTVWDRIKEYEDEQVTKPTV